MVSLARIAQALGSSQLELVAGAADLTRPGAGGGPTLVRADEGDRGPYGLGQARLLVQGDRPFYPMTFVADNADPGEFHSHAEDEFVHVLAGRCVVDLGAQGQFRLAPGDSLFYAGQVPHRWFSPTGRTYRLFVVKQHVALGEPVVRLAAAPSDGDRQEAP
jgi:quercetin dioxygenase-like cupin family protein